MNKCTSHNDSDLRQSPGRSQSASVFFKFNYFIYLFLAALSLRCCAPAFSSCSERGLLFIVERRLLIAMASHCGGSSCCGARALGCLCFYLDLVLITYASRDYSVRRLISYLCCILTLFTNSALVETYDSIRFGK